MEGRKRGTGSVSPTPNAKKARGRGRRESQSSTLSSGSRSSSSKRTVLLNADLVDHSINERRWGWRASYCQRALLARLKVEVDINKTNFLNNYEYVRAVKFFSVQNSDASVKVDEYQCNYGQRSMLPSVMMERIADACPHFHKDVILVNLDSPLWKNVRAGLCTLRLKYVSHVTYDGKVGWRTGVLEQDQDECGSTGVWDNADGAENTSESATANEAIDDAADLVTSFEQALLTDMTNGEGKDFVLHLAQAVKQTLRFKFITCLVTSNHSRLNTKVEMVAPEDTTNWHRAFTTEPPEPQEIPCNADSDAASTSSDVSIEWQKPVRKLPVQKASAVVPNVLWYLPDFPGQFPLVVEVKPDKFALADGISQCYKQMLAKFFFQDSIFGLLLTPRDYVLLFAHKGKKKNIDLYVQTPIDFGGGTGEWSFNSGGFFQLVETLAKIMDWAGRMSGRHK